MDNILNNILLENFQEFKKVYSRFLPALEKISNARDLYNVFYGGVF